MNYQVIYDTLILRARARVLEGYSERHHVIPRCLGGTNDSQNLVRLTPEEHFIAHQLLVKIHPGNHRLVLAVLLASVNGTYTQRSNKRYGWLRRKHAVAQSALLKGKKKPPFTSEHKAALSAAHKGKHLSASHCAAQSRGKKGKPLSLETLAKRPQKGHGKPASAERKAKISAAQKGRPLTPEHKLAVGIAARERERRKRENLGAQL